MYEQIATLKLHCYSFFADITWYGIFLDAIELCNSKCDTDCLKISATLKNLHKIESFAVTLSLLPLQPI